MGKRCYRRDWKLVNFGFDYFRDKCRIMWKCTFCHLLSRLARIRTGLEEWGFLLFLLVAGALLPLAVHLVERLFLPLELAPLGVQVRKLKIQFFLLIFVALLKLLNILLTLRFNYVAKSDTPPLLTSLRTLLKFGFQIFHPVFSKFSKIKNKIQNFFLIYFFFTKKIIWGPQ